MLPFDKTDGYDVLSLGQVCAGVGEADAVIHLAAMSGVEQSRDSVLDAWALNVMGTVNMLEACRLSGTPVVIASSNHIYGHGDKPVTEDAPQLQLDTYSATKHAADLAARSYAHNYGLPVAIVRNTNCFGPGDPHEDHIIPATILSLLNGERPVIKSDGKLVKSYLYVDDVAEAYIAIMDALLDGRAKPGEAFNVSGERLSVLEVVNLIGHVWCEVVHHEAPPLGSITVDAIVLGQPNDQTDENLSSRKVREVVGWMPRHSMADALSKTIEGFRARTKVTA